MLSVKRSLGFRVPGQAGRGLEAGSAQRIQVLVQPRCMGATPAGGRQQPGVTLKPQVANRRGSPEPCRGASAPKVLSRWGIKQVLVQVAQREV